MAATIRKLRCYLKILIPGKLYSAAFCPEKRKTFMGCLILLPLLFICGYWLQ